MSAMAISLHNGILTLPRFVILCRLSKSMKQLLGKDCLFASLSTLSTRNGPSTLLESPTAVSRTPLRSLPYLEYF